MTLLRTYSFALDATTDQEALLLSNCGAARFAYNHLLASVKAVMDQREAERSYGIMEEDLTPAVRWSHYSLRKLFNEHKGEVAPWWCEVSKEAFSSGASQLAEALQNWSSSKSGKRAGRRVGFPRFKDRSARRSFTYTTGALKLGADRRSIHLPRIGWVGLRESTAKLSRRLDKGTARITRVTVAYDRGRWKVSCLVHITPSRAFDTHPSSGKNVGVDLGCKSWLVAASPHGEEVLRLDPPDRLRKVEEKIRRVQRAGSRKIMGSRKAGVAKSNRARRYEQRLAKLHAHSANIREHELHVATTRLARKYGSIVVEDLSVAGMMTRGGARKTGLNRAVARSAFATTRRMLQYKTEREGGKLVVADRFFPSSKTCSGCGAVKAKLPLSDRTYECHECSITLDRDLNAAINLARVVPGPAGSGPVAGRGGLRQTRSLSGDRAVACETSTAPRRSRSASEDAQATCTFVHVA